MRRMVSPSICRELMDQKPGDGSAEARSHPDIDQNINFATQACKYWPGWPAFKHGPISV